MTFNLGQYHIYRYLYCSHNCCLGKKLLEQKKLVSCPAQCILLEQGSTAFYAT